MVGLYIIFIAYIVLSICGFIVMVGAHRTTQDQLDDLKEHLSDVQTRIDNLKESIDDLEEYINDVQTRMDSIEEQASEENESIEKAVSNVFNLVDDFLEGKKDLEGLEDEKRQSIQQ